MVRSGIVTQLNRHEGSGTIEDANGREFFFHESECCEEEIFSVGTQVTFVKDTDFKSTNVAALVKRSALCPYRKAA